MTTLAANSARDYTLGDRGEYAVIASEIIYEGSAVGLVDATGHARPLANLDTFVGFAEAKVDNSAGSAADLNVRTYKQGVIKLSVTGAVITDVGQPVYATDDNAFTFIPTSAVYIGMVERFVSAGVVEVSFNVGDVDPYSVYGSPENYETKSANYTLDILDVGKVLFIDTDAFLVTLPVVATPVECTIVNIGAFGAVLVAVSPAAADMIHAPDIAGTNDKDHLNTKATACRGDLVKISSASGDANGHAVIDQKGIWAQEG